MGFRFSRRVSIIPGVRLNVGLRGTSLSVGPRGASVTMSKRGVHGNVGIPGTGLSYRTRLDSPNRREGGRPRDSGPQLPARAMAKLIGDQIFFYDEAERPLDDSLVQTVRRLMKDEVQVLLETNADARNAHTDDLTRLHHDVPTSIASRPLSGKPSREQFADQESYMSALMMWRAQAANEGPDREALEIAVLDALGALDWPRETNVAIELRGSRLLLDVDLPEIEDMPRSRWSASISQCRLLEKPMTQKDIAGVYLGHVASLLLRLIGHAMAVDKHIGAVGLSAYTQRSGSTGRVTDEYVASVEVTRDRWSEVDCTRMQEIDPESLLRRFDARLETNSRGILKVQQPIE